jgi:hypothetical protein
VHGGEALAGAERAAPRGTVPGVRGTLATDYVGLIDHDVPQLAKALANGAYRLDLPLGAGWRGWPSHIRGCSTSMIPATHGRQLVAEGLGSAFLLAAVVGSGIMGGRLAGGNVAVALLANAVATGAALEALLLTSGPISGAHLNPLVTLGEAWQGVRPWTDVRATS